MATGDHAGAHISQAEETGVVRAHIDHAVDAVHGDGGDSPDLLAQGDALPVLAAVRGAEEGQFIGRTHVDHIGQTAVLGHGVDNDAIRGGDGHPCAGLADEELAAVHGVVQAGRGGGGGKVSHIDQVGLHHRGLRGDVHGQGHTGKGHGGDQDGDGDKGEFAHVHGISPSWPKIWGPVPDCSQPAFAYVP